jgi:hypothetical protein
MTLKLCTRILRVQAIILLRVLRELSTLVISFPEQWMGNKLRILRTADSSTTRCLLRRCWSGAAVLTVNPLSASNRFRVPWLELLFASYNSAPRIRSGSANHSAATLSLLLLLVPLSRCALMRTACNPLHSCNRNSVDLLVF